MKKKQTSSNEAAAILLTITGCFIQLAPVLNAYPVGGIILIVIIALGGICWTVKRKE